MTDDIKLPPLPSGNVAHLIAAQAAEIEALRAERDALRAESAELRERVRELEADAARYRWLRKGVHDDIAVVRGLGAMDYGMSAVVYTYSEELDGDDLDAAIDAMLKAREGTSQ